MSKTKRHPAAAHPEQKLLEVKGELSQQCTSLTIKVDALHKYREIILQRHQLSTQVGLYHLSAMIHCGDSLLEVKSMLPHGEFSRWVADNFSPETGLTLRTCQRYMAKAKAFRKFLHQQASLSNIDATTVSLLADDALVQEFWRSLAKTAPSSPRLEQRPRLAPTIVTAVRAFLGTIDLDPCAVHGDSYVDAGGIELGEQDVSLQADTIWSGNVFGCLPPRISVAPWVKKGLSQLQQGHATNVVFHLAIAQIPDVLELYPATSFCLLGPSQPGLSPAPAAPDKAMAIAHWSLHSRRRQFVKAFQSLGAIVVTLNQSPPPTGY